MIGGNIASNAGGLQALRYGVMRNLVLGLEVVLADGTIISSMNKMMKNNAGYDLKQLFIGSEGTLGIITRAVLKMEDLPKTRCTAFIALESFEMAVQLLQYSKKHLNNGLTSFELLWQDYYTLMTSPPSPYSPPLSQTFPFYVLMETLGQDAEKDKKMFEEFLEKSLEDELIADAAIAQSQQELDWFWGIRENVELVFSVHSPIFLFDVSLAISDIDVYIKKVRAELQNIWPDLHFYSFGHMGDGNLHLFVSCGNDDTSTRHRVEEIIYKPLQEIDGSITGEHGIGFFQIGGGIAGDFPICVVPMMYQDLEWHGVPFWSYFCQISDSTTSYGSYSGAVPNEKITWGKLGVETPKFIVESDASIVAPLMFGYILGW